MFSELAKHYDMQIPCNNIVLCDFDKMHKQVNGIQEKLLSIKLFIAPKLSYQSRENRKGGILYFNLAKKIVLVHDIK